MDPNEEKEVIEEEVITEEEKPKREVEKTILKHYVRKEKPKADETVEVTEEVAKGVTVEEEKKCPFCSRDIPVVAKHCPYCGKALDEQVQKQQKKKRTMILSTAAIAAIAIGLYLFALPSYQKGSQYKGALSKLAEGNYAEARQEFAALPGYKDADDYVIYCSALESFANGDLEKAKTRLENVSGLEDAEKYINYISAFQAIEKTSDPEKYAEAKEFFEKAGDLLDSAGMARFCEGIEAFLKEKDSDATNVFKELINDKNVSDYYLNTANNIVTFLAAKAKFDQNDYSGLNDFKSIAGSDDTFVSNKASDYANYIEGKEAYEKELYFTAYSCFYKCRSLKDAIELCNSCIQERPSSGIMYKDTSSSVSVTIHDSSDGDDMYIKIYDADDNLIETVYIRDGGAVTAYFQSGKIRMAIAEGDPEWWFGTNEAFGSHGLYERLLLDGSNEYYNFPSGGAYDLRFKVSGGSGETVGSKPSNYGDF